MATLGGELGVRLDAVALRSVDVALLRIRSPRLRPSDAATAARPRN